MQKWEYLHIYRGRGWKEGKAYLDNSRSIKEEEWHSAGKWIDRIVTSTENIESPYNNLSDAITKLGDQGWELVAITNRSGVLGGGKLHEVNGSPGYGESVYSDFAGFTNEELWVFKRPKE